jgi:hypothetical protein
MKPIKKYLYYLLKNKIIIIRDNGVARSHSIRPTPSVNVISCKQPLSVEGCYQGGQPHDSFVMVNWDDGRWCSQPHDRKVKINFVPNVPPCFLIFASFHHMRFVSFRGEVELLVYCIYSFVSL